MPTRGNRGTFIRYMACRVTLTLTCGKFYCQLGRGVLKAMTLSAVVIMMSMASCSSASDSSDLSRPEALIMSTGDENYVVVSTESGKIISNKSFTTTGEFSEVSNGVFWIYKNGEYWLHSAKEPSVSIQSVPYKMVTKFAANRAVVGDGISPVRIIDTKGKVVKELPENVSAMWPFSSDGLAAFRDSESSLCGYIDTDGDVKIAPQYSFCEPFNEGYAVVSEGDGSEVSSYLIDEQGKRTCGNKDFHFYTNRVSSGVIPTYELLDDDEDSDETPSSTITLTYINPTGETVITTEMQYGYSENYSVNAIDGCVVYFDNNGKCGVKNLDGKVVLEPNYDAVEIVSSKVFIVHRNYESAIVEAGDKLIDGYYEYPTGFYPLGNNRYVKTAPNPTSTKEQIVAGPGGDPLILKANAYWIYKDANTKISDGFTWWQNRLYMKLDAPVSYTNPSAIFEPVLSQISAEQIFGFAKDASIIDAAAKFDWVENENTFANFRGTVKNYYYELPNGNYQQIKMVFTEDMVKPVIHSETRGSGWMSYEETVVDGYAFNPNSKLQYINVDFNDFDGVSVKDAARLLCKAMEAVGFKMANPDASSHVPILRLENDSNFVEAKVADMYDYITLEFSIPQSK